MGIAVQPLQARVCINLKAPTVWVAHQDERRPVVRADIAVLIYCRLPAEIDEFYLGVSEAIECPLTAELRPKLSVPVSAQSPPHAGSRRDFQENDATCAFR
jgi:hypothetical protein